MELSLLKEYSYKDEIQTYVARQDPQQVLNFTGICTNVPEILSQYHQRTESQCT